MEEKFEQICEDCGKSIEGNINYISGYPYCDKCYERNVNYKGIHDSDYCPKPVFYGNGEYYVITVDIDGGGYLDINAEKLLDAFNKKHEEYMYIVHNDKLKEGFRLVFRPMTSDYFENNIGWDKLKSIIDNMGYKIININTAK